jgi:hypothetical protein
MGHRTASASLIEENYPVRFGIEKGTVIRLATGTRPTVQEQNGHSGWISAFFHINPVLIPLELMDRVGLDFWVKNSHDRLRPDRILDLA